MDKKEKQFWNTQDKISCFIAGFLIGALAVYFIHYNLINHVNQ